MAQPSTVTSEYEAAENSGTRLLNDVGFFLTKTKDDDGPSKSLFNDETGLSSNSSETDPVSSRPYRLDQYPRTGFSFGPFHRKMICL
ncbi:hypothetical protein AVEN_25590-1 [Araneus ventricosus]|uniref:Uncharacterized protein n=1 Tax=Araneus ventricosus TaxID=182803 RepID=A0A4Y2RHK3_ARAVE|nr:hypothetical protein AVEN_25590-1 [Araneus ventricosus]